MTKSLSATEMERRINLDSEVALFMINKGWASAYTKTKVLAHMFNIIEMVEITDELLSNKLISVKDKNNGNTLYEVTPLGKSYLENHLNAISSEAIAHYTKNIEFTATVFGSTNK